MTILIERRQARAALSNEFLGVIAGCGRQFFRHGKRVSTFEVDDRGRIWFIDAYSQRRIYTHHRYEWKGFTNGGTIRTLIEDLREYIKTGDRPNLNIGPWPAHFCGGDLWAYGDDMSKVRAAAERLK